VSASPTQLHIREVSTGPDPGTRGPGGRVSGSTTHSRAALICLALATAASGTYLLILQAHLTFYGDDWEFLLKRRAFSADAFLNPHNDHIVVIPVAIYKALLAVFGMSSAMPFQVVATLIFLLSAVLLFAYLRRRVGDWPALLGSILILFLGAAWADLLWSFQMGLSGSMAAGIGALLALDRDDRKGDVIACALLVVATLFSELGVLFAVGAFVSVALGPSPRRRRLYVALVPVAVYTVWYLGWGHKGPQTANFHNFVNSPGFVFDAISANLASLFGLTTPLSGTPGGDIHGLNWGRALLVIAIVLAIWRLWRTGRPSRWLWAVLATGGAFWFLSALNAIPGLRDASSGRYQYPGAIFVLLIVAEFLRGVRANRRFLIAASAVTVVAAASGVILLHDGYGVKKEQSDALRARLAAVAIGRGAESRNFRIGFPPFTVVPARVYFSAVDAFGSPALSESQLVASSRRVVGDRILIKEEGIKLNPEPRSSQGLCETLRADPSGLTAMSLLPGNYTLTVQSGLGAAIGLARFAHLPRVDLGAVAHGVPASISIPRDHSTRPWRLASRGPSDVTVCLVAWA
jgi:hypothetical protein